MIRVLIADDHGLMRAGLRAMLQASADVEVVGDAADGITAIALADQLRPDVLLADITMPGLDGIGVARRLSQTQPQTRVLILTMHEDGNLVRDALAAGAAGYIAKRALETELLDAIRTVHAGERYLDASLLPASATDRAVEQPPVSAALLSESEARFLILLARGATNSETAEALGISLAQVQQLREQVAARYGLRSRVEIARFVRASNLAP